MCPACFSRKFVNFGKGRPFIIDQKSSTVNKIYTVLWQSFVIFFKSEKQYFFILFNLLLFKMLYKDIILQNAVLFESCGSNIASSPLN